MRTWLPLVCLAFACASTSSGPQHEAPPPSGASAEGGEAVGSSGGSDEHQPEIVHTGKKLNLSWSDAQDRYSKKGSKCGGSDAPDQTIGAPDQRNEMQMGRDKVVTYGFHFKEGTLAITCRNEHVDHIRVLSK